MSPRPVDIKSKVPDLAHHVPKWSTFVHIGNLTKLRYEPGSGFHHANYESGLLLYALLQKFRPVSVLEIGTGRGFASLCMAMAMRDAGIDGRIVTIDVKGYDEPQMWAIDDGCGPRIERLSLRDVWEEHFDERLRARIECVTADSVAGLARLEARGFRPELVYIDGDHSYPIVHHDFYASLKLARRPFRILLDDYFPRSDVYGVRRLVDDQIAPVFEAEAIYTDRRWPGEPEAGTPISEADHAQVLIDSERLRWPLDEALPPAKVDAIVRRHRRWGKALVALEAIRSGVRRRLARVA